MFKLDLEKPEEPEMKLPTSIGYYKNQKNSRKTSTSVSLTTIKALSLWITTEENSSRDGNTRSPYLSPEKPVSMSRSNSYNWTWNNGLIPNWEGSTSRLYIVTLCI